MKRSFRFAFGACIWLMLAAVRADIAPPSDYVEQCVLDKQQGRGESCRACGASFQGRDECLKLGNQGYTHRCSTYGASVWSEIWCKEPRSGRDTKP